MVRSTCSGLAKRVRAKIFQASTSEVYGDPTIHPQTSNIGIKRTQCSEAVGGWDEKLFFDYSARPEDKSNFIHVGGFNSQDMTATSSRMLLCRAQREPITIFRGRSTSTV